MKEQVVTNGIHTYTDAEKYVPADSPAVQEHINWFMGLKLGLMMHWAPGCQLGTYESWPLSDGDGSWSQEDVDWTDIPTFKEQYINANKTFNPVKFRPDRWASLAKDAASGISCSLPNTTMDSACLIQKLPITKLRMNPVLFTPAPMLILQAPCMMLSAKKDLPSLLTSPNRTGTAIITGTANSGRHQPGI